MSTSHNNHRHCYLLRGQPNNVLPAFLRLCDNFSSVLICAQDPTPYQALHKSNSKTPTKTLAFKQVKNELGQTHDGVLVDLTQGISASALAILAGTVVGQGVLVIVLPDADWLALDDDDMARHLPWPLRPSDVSSYFKHYFLNKLIHEASPFNPLALENIKPIAPIIQADALIKLNASTNSNTGNTYQDEVQTKQSRTYCGSWSR